MANAEHVRRLKQGVLAWNSWRHEESTKNPDFTDADLSNMNLDDINLEGAWLRRADLRQTRLTVARLIAVDFEGADLNGAVLDHSDFWSANFRNANLKNASLIFSKLHSVFMQNTDLTGAQFAETIFADLNLTHVVNLTTCRHISPSSIDHRTLQRSWSLPLVFLRGIGLPDTLIDYLPSLLIQAIQHYSCFISYSSIDQDFANRLHADLQNNAVRCWFAPHDMPIGGKILDEIDAAIRLRDKVLLILSEHSIKSDWVEDQVTKAYEEERRRGQIVLFPVRLDDAVMDTDEAWAVKLRARHIGDFTRWKDHDAYRKRLERVLRDLKVQNTDCKL